MTADREPREPPPAAQRSDRRWTAADLLTMSRIPLAVLFLLIPSNPGRLIVLAAAGATDLTDGFVARRWGSSRLGAFLDPVADKVFMAAAFAVVLLSGRLQWYEIIAVLARDIVAAAAFALTVWFRRPATIPARLGGKIVTIGQLFTLLAFLINSPLLRPLAWATGAIALYALWDYHRADAKERRAL